MQQKLVILLIVAFLPFYGISQLQINWQQCYGGSEADGAQNLIKTGNDFIIVGYTGSHDGDISYSHGLGDGWIVKTDSIGNLLWEKTYGGSDAENLWDGFSTINGTGFYLLGSSLSIDGDCAGNPYPGAGNAWAVKTDTSGNVVWSKMYGGTRLEEVNAGTATTDGGVVIYGLTSSDDGDVTNYYGAYDMWGIKLDSLGNKDWDLSIGTSSFDYGKIVIQTADHGYLFSGGASFAGTPGNITCTPHNYKPEAVIVKTDSAGNIEWQNCYGGSAGEMALGLLEINDGYLFSAIAYSNDGDVTGHHGSDNSDIWLVKLDFSGNIVWEHCYGGTDYDDAFNLFKTTDGGYMVFGETSSHDGDVVGNHSNQYNTDIWIFKIDSIGNMLWQKCIGGVSTQEVFKGVQRISDSEYVVAATTEGDGFTGNMDCATHGLNRDFWLFKVTDTSTIVGLSEEKAFLEQKVYPNPARDYVILELPVKPVSPAVFSVHDIYGRLITTLPVKAKQTVWITRSVKAGVYVYTLVGKGITVSGKIVVRE